MANDKLAHSEDNWFERDFGAPDGSSPDRKRGASRGGGGNARRQAYALGVLLAITLVAGLALGAFSSPRAEAPATPAQLEPTARQAAAIKLAGAHPKTAILERGLVARLDRLFQERREDTAPLDDGPQGTPAGASSLAVETSELDRTRLRRTRGATAVPRRAPTGATLKPRQAGAKDLDDKAKSAALPDKASGQAVDRAALEAQLAKAKGLTNNPSKAIAAYRKALKLSPYSATARMGLGQALYESGRSAEALAEFEAILKGTPSHPQALIWAASTAQSAGNKAGARGYYQRYLEKFPSGSRAKEVRKILADMP